MTGLLAHRSYLIAQGGLSLSAPADVVTSCVIKTQPPSLGSMAQLDGSPSNRKRHRSQCRVPRQAKRWKLGTKRAWCPVFPAVPAMLRHSGRTETLTRNEIHQPQQKEESGNSISPRRGQSKRRMRGLNSDRERVAGATETAAMRHGVLARTGVPFFAAQLYEHVCNTEHRHYASDIASGRLVRVLAERCAPVPGYHLYYASRKLQSPAFALVVKALRDRVAQRSQASC